MISIEHSKIGNEFHVIINEDMFDSIVVKKPFYDPKKKIASS
ncbi:hypothetical protein ACIJYD_04415 [Candidatus Pelagibacter bacterium nBUS_33]